MEFQIETYFDEDTKKKMVYIAANDGASGAKYPYETAADIGKAVQQYIENYYPDQI